MKNDPIYYVSYNRFTGKPYVWSKYLFWVVTGFSYFIFLFISVIMVIDGPEIFSDFLLFHIVFFFIMAILFYYGRRAAREHRRKHGAEYLRRLDDDE